MISSNVNPSFSFNTGSKNYYTIDALRESNSLQKYSEASYNDNSGYAAPSYFNARKPKKHLRRYMKYVPERKEFLSMYSKNGTSPRRIDDPRHAGTYLTMPTSYEKISQPFHSSWQANTIDEKDIPLVEHALEDIHNKAKHYFALYEAERKRRKKLEETAYFFESGNQRLWETLQKETEKAHILIQTLESLKGDPYTLKTIIQRIDLIYIQLDTLVQSLAGLACFMAYKEQSKVEAVNTVLDYLFPCKTLDPRLNALYGTTYYYKQSLSADPDVVNERQAIEVKENAPKFGKNIEPSNDVTSLGYKDTTGTKASNASQSNVPLEGLQMHIHSISLLSLKESSNISCYFRYDNELPQNVKNEDDRFLFTSTIKNKANIDKNCTLKSVPPKVAGKIPSYCIDIWHKSNNVLYGTATCNVFDPSTLSKDSTWTIKDLSSQSIGFITVTILPVPLEAMLPALRYQLYKQATAKKEALNKDNKSEHVRFQNPSNHKSNKVTLGSKVSMSETSKKQTLVKKKQISGPEPALLTVPLPSSKTSAVTESSTKSLSKIKPDISGHHNTEDETSNNNALKTNLLGKKNAVDVVSITTLKTKKKVPGLNPLRSIKGVYTKFIENKLSSYNTSIFMFSEFKQSTSRNIQETVEHKSKPMEKNDTNEKMSQIKKENSHEIVVTKPTSLDSETPAPSNLKQPVVLKSIKSPSIFTEKTNTMNSKKPSILQLKKTASFNLEKPDLLELKTLTFSKSEKPAPSELKKPNFLDLKKPNFSELKKPGLLELKKPGLLELKKPGLLELKKPALLELKKPGLLELKKPGLLESKKPGLLELKKPGLLELKKPGLLELKKPAQLDLKKPAQLDLKKPAQLDLKKPVQLDLKKPAQLDLKKPAQLDLKKPAQLDLKKFVQLDLKKPAQLDLKKFVQLDLKKPAQLDLKKFVQLDLKKPAQLDLKKPVQLDLKKPAQLDLKKPVQLDLKKPVQLDLKKPVQLDLKKPAQLDIEIPSPLALNNNSNLDLENRHQLDVEKPRSGDMKQYSNMKITQSKITTNGNTKQEYMSKDKGSVSFKGTIVKFTNIKSNGTDNVKLQNTKPFTKNGNISKKNQTFESSVEKKANVGKRELKNRIKNSSRDLPEIESKKKNRYLQKLTNKGETKDSKINTEENEQKKSKIKALFLPQKKSINYESKKHSKRNISFKTLEDTPTKKGRKKESMSNLVKNLRKKHPSHNTLEVDESDNKIKELSGETNKGRFRIFKKITKRLFNTSNRG
ncbi:uncharacterized protein LOC128884427 isoform X2 [Hylaeus volcanicus]|uniref:uncharacterized protein LOC128884427 isoform X2 n=1 Tax=Hylaeus volcanicus TaxID=313075 RepID=UPI0023B78932|nr:uncharacterized protein LOC128884427 isoform X2 [Hylaeus volcanicus]